MGGFSKGEIATGEVNCRNVLHLFILTEQMLSSASEEKHWDEHWKTKKRQRETMYSRGRKGFVRMRWPESTPQKPSLKGLGPHGGWPVQRDTQAEAYETPNQRKNKQAKVYTYPAN